MAHKLLFYICKRERVQGSRFSAEGQALNPLPDLDTRHEQQLAKIQSVASDLDILYRLLYNKKYH